MRRRIGRSVLGVGLVAAPLEWEDVVEEDPEPVSGRGLLMVAAGAQGLRKACRQAQQQ